MILPDTTKPRHGFEPSLAMRFRIRSGTRSPMRTPLSARTFRLPSAPLRLRRISRASFAGQQDTYLSVDSRICWPQSVTVGPHCGRPARWLTGRARASIRQASAWRSSFSRWSTPSPPGSCSPPASNGRRDETVISAAWGLGESVVSGAVNTDNFVVHTPDGTVLSSEIADKAVATVYAEQRTKSPVPAEQRKRPVLSEAEAAELAASGIRIENHYGAPQDIEWARANGQVLDSASRPITALPSLRHRRRRTGACPSHRHVRPGQHCRAAA